LSARSLSKEIENIGIKEEIPQLRRDESTASTCDFSEPGNISSSGLTSPIGEVITRSFSDSQGRKKEIHIPKLRISIEWDILGRTVFYWGNEILFKTLFKLDKNWFRKKDLY